MLDILNKSFIGEVNDFLSKYETPDTWTLLPDVHFDSESSLKDYSEMGTEFWVAKTLMQLGGFQKDISVNRDTELKYFYKYHNYACSFENFNISKFAWQGQNDPKETKWFDEYLSDFSSAYSGEPHKAFLETIQRYNMLVTYTTTKLTNHNYMISNYSIDGKQAIRFDGKEIIKNYDSLFSGKIKPIRGFVRYNKYGKKDFMKAIWSVYLVTSDKKYLNFMLMLSSVFIKGNCMSEEAEYRFMVITSNKLDAIDVNCVHKACMKFACELQPQNPYYVNSSINCDTCIYKPTRCTSC